MIREISYSQVKDSLKTGDLVLFHGVETTSKIIELIEWSYWSHIGMVILPKDIGMEGEEPLFWESTASGDGIMDYISGKPKDCGPMLVSLSDRIKVDLDNHFDTHFKIKYSSRSMESEELEALKKFILTMNSKGFPSPEDTFHYYIEGRYHNTKAPEQNVFCSELTALTLMELGFISTDYVANGYCPDDFNQDTNIPVLKPLIFSDGAHINKWR